MNATLLFLGLCLLGAEPTSTTGSISGIVLSGSRPTETVANADVVLRMIEHGSAPVPVAQTTSDEDGRFVFHDLPVGDDIVYLPGANLSDVHYPGSRVRLNENQTQAMVKLLAFETVDDPSPLIANKHEIVIQASAGVLEITESILIENPTRKTYVGKKTRDTAPVTLRLLVPSDFESVTFHDEFHGRSFFVLDGKLMTDIPWTPGSRKIGFTYRLPIEQRGRLLTRRLDLPCADVTVRVKGDIQHVSCSLPTAHQSEREICFEQSGQLFPAGHQLRIQLGKLPVRPMNYARWFAAGILVIVTAAIMAPAAWKHWRRSEKTARHGKPAASVQRRAA